MSVELSFFMFVWCLSQVWSHLCPRVLRNRLSLELSYVATSNWEPRTDCTALCLFLVPTPASIGGPHWVPSPPLRNVLTSQASHGAGWKDGMDIDPWAGFSAVMRTISHRARTRGRHFKCRIKRGTENLRNQHTSHFNAIFINKNECKKPWWTKYEMLKQRQDQLNSAVPAILQPGSKGKTLTTDCVFLCPWQVLHSAHPRSSWRRGSFPHESLSALATGCMLLVRLETYLLGRPLQVFLWLSPFFSWYERLHPVCFLPSEGQILFSMITFW